MTPFKILTYDSLYFASGAMNSTRFNDLSSHFQDKIYSSFKGKLRLAILERDFEKFNLIKNNFNILDIGAGLGQFSLYLASHQNQLTLLESSENMLNIAKERFSINNLGANFIHDKLQSIPEILDQSYDLVLLHAVIEWLNNPFDIIPILKKITHQGSIISLLFYNLNGLIYHNLVRGNYRYVEKNNFHGEHGGLTPISPIDPAILEQALLDNNYKIIHKSGIRTYYDFMTKENKQKISEEDHIKMELNYSDKPEYLPHARYLHWLIQPCS